MRAWDHLLEQYIAQYRARGCCDASVRRAQGVLSRWSLWLRTRRPRPQLQSMEADLLVAYLRSQTSFRSKVTVYGTLSVIRGMGDYPIPSSVTGTHPDSNTADSDRRGHVRSVRLGNPEP